MYNSDLMKAIITVPLKKKKCLVLQWFFMWLHMSIWPSEFKPLGKNGYTEVPPQLWQLIIGTVLQSNLKEKEK